MDLPYSERLTANRVDLLGPAHEIDVALLISLCPVSNREVLKDLRRFIPAKVIVTGIQPGLGTDDVGGQHPWLYLRKPSAQSAHQLAGKRLLDKREWAALRFKWRGLTVPWSRL
jgi:hypothetical protein